MSTSPVESSIWVIVPIMVQGYLPHGMSLAKHVSAVPAMMPSFEQSEGSLADGCIANLSIGIWFPMFARGRACDVGETGGQYGVL